MILLPSHQHFHLSSRSSPFLTFTSPIRSLPNLVAQLVLSLLNYPGPRFLLTWDGLAHHLTYSLWSLTQIVTAMMVGMIWQNLLLWNYLTPGSAVTRIWHTTYLQGLLGPMATSILFLLGPSTVTTSAARPIPGSQTLSATMLEPQQHSKMHISRRVRPPLLFGKPTSPPNSLYKQKLPSSMLSIYAALTGHSTPLSMNLQHQSAPHQTTCCLPGSGHLRPRQSHYAPPPSLCLFSHQSLSCLSVSIVTLALTVTVMVVTVVWLAQSTCNLQSRQPLCQMSPHSPHLLAHTMYCPFQQLQQTPFPSLSNLLIPFLEGGEM